jgi:hypothetical protein
VVVSVIDSRDFARVTRLDFSFPCCSPLADNRRMRSWEALVPRKLTPSGAVSTAFLSIAKTDLRAAAKHVCELPYGRNGDPDDPLAVLAEHRGTCSTKHALLRRLAIEQEIDVVLILGIYEMNDATHLALAQFCRVAD